LLRQVGLEAVRDHVQSLADTVVEQALQRDWDLMTPGEPDRRGPLVMLGCRDVQALLSALAGRGILCSTRDGALRTSFHYYNSADDVFALIDALDDNGGLMKSIAHRWGSREPFWGGCTPWVWGGPPGRRRVRISGGTRTAETGGLAGLAPGRRRG